MRLKHEIETFLEDRTAHFEDLTRQWNEKYEREVQELDERICETKDVMIALKLKYDELVEQYNTREEEVREYLEDKKVKEDASTLAERRYEAIVKIQSWWKGIMVRRGLGQYKRKKAKKGKKSKSKKK